MTVRIGGSCATGAGIKTDVPSAERSNGQADVMSLPEVHGYIQKKRGVKIGNRQYYFYPVAQVAADLKTTTQEVNDFTSRYGMKNNYTGIWERVMTPKGEAREFMYFEGLPDLMNIMRYRDSKVTWKGENDDV